MDAATWLTAAWHGGGDPATQSAFYAARFNEVVARQFASPYWAMLELESDKTGVSYPEVLPFSGTVNPAYQDPLRQPTDCQYHGYSRVYTTPVYPSFGEDKSPGWQGEVQSSKFRDLWHTTRILTFTIPLNQQNATNRPIILAMNITIEATATIRGNKVWFAPITIARVRNSGWNPELETNTPTNFRPEWAFSGMLPGDSVGGWSHDEAVALWRYGSWKWLEKQKNTGQIVTVEIGTTPSLGRYYSRNDLVTVTHDETVAVYWPLGPGE